MNDDTDIQSAITSLQSSVSTLQSSSSSSSGLSFVAYKFMFYVGKTGSTGADVITGANNKYFNIRQVNGANNLDWFSDNSNYINILHLNYFNGCSLVYFKEFSNNTMSISGSTTDTWYTNSKKIVLIDTISSTFGYTFIIPGSGGRIYLVCSSTATNALNIQGYNIVLAKQT